MYVIQVDNKQFELKQEEISCFGLLDIMSKDLQTKGPIPVNMKPEIFEIILDYVREKFIPLKRFSTD